MTGRGSADRSVIGRDAELSVLHAFIHDMSGVGNALVIASEPGTGGTTLLEYALCEARANDMPLVVVPGAECDRTQRFAGVRRLFAELSEASLVSSAHLAESGAILADPTGASSRLAAFTATFLSALCRAGSDSRLLIAVDDAHELDDESMEVLAFVARRLRGGQAGMLVVTHAETGPLSARSHFPTVRVGPLPDTAGSDLLASLFHDLSPDVRELLVAAAEGMPLALVECARALVGEQRVRADAVPAVLPLSDRLRHVLTVPLVGLSGDVRLLLLLLALDSSVSPQMLKHVTGLDVHETLGPALSTGLVTMEQRGTLTFPRPMMRSAVVAAATGEQRRHAHALLANAVADQAERRAHHLALSVERPDARAAAALEDAAVHAFLRNDGRAASVAMSRASEMWGDIEGGRPDYVGCAASEFNPPSSPYLPTNPTSEPTQAVWEPPCGLSGSVLVASLALDLGRPVVARQTLTRALENPGPDAADDTVNYAVDLLLSICYFAGSTEAWSDLARTIDLLGERGNGFLRLVRHLGVPGAGLSPSQLAELDAALDRLPSEDNPRVVIHLATVAVAVGRGFDCQVPLWRVLRHDTALPRRALAAALLAAVADSAGDTVEAAKAIDHGLELCSASSHVPYAMLLRSVLALAFANAGALTLRTLTDEVLTWAKPAGASTLIENAHWALAREALSRSDYAAAHRQFDALGCDGGVEGLLAHRPEMVFDVVEAAAGSGHRALARACAERARPGQSGRLDLLALGARAVASDPDSTGGFEAALTAGGTARWMFDTARIRLAYGERLKRAGARELAREHLDAALHTFEVWQAEPWIARTSAQLRLAGGTAVGTGNDRPLTRQERAVTELAGSGLTNREIAERLHLSTRTVASHLYRIFAKLGVSSRAQLPAVSLPRGGPVECADQSGR